MAQNKNALIRYKTIDKCLQNQYRKWTLEDLIEACSEALYEYEGRDISVSKRSIQLDIQLMRSDKLGYNAPIVVYEKKYYKYDVEGYTITDIPLTENDMNVLTEAVEMLKHFKDFSLFDELGGVIQKLEDKVYVEKHHQSSIIQLDKNESLKGLEFLDTLYQAILKKIGLQVNYQSFKARSASMIPVHPLILKEFNNRWFLVCRRDGSQNILTLALDRMVHVELDFRIEYDIGRFDSNTYYDHTIGVTVLKNSRPQPIHLYIDAENAPYVLTKPFHTSQKVLCEHDDGCITIEIRVHQNYELERLILGFGESIEVIKPKRLRNRIKDKLITAARLYATEFE